MTGLYRVFDAATRRRGRPEKYRYDPLFDGRVHKLLGADAQLVQTIRLAAGRRGLLIEQRKVLGGYEVTVHAGNGTRTPARPARPVRLHGWETPA